MIEFEKWWENHKTTEQYRRKTARHDAKAAWNHRQKTIDEQAARIAELEKELSSMTGERNQWRALCEVFRKELVELGRLG